MAYAVILSPAAKRDIGRLGAKMTERVWKALQALEHTPRPKGIKPLKKQPGYRIRVGYCRIIFDIREQEREVVILTIGLRAGVYKMAKRRA